MALTYRLRTGCAYRSDLSLEIQQFTPLRTCSIPIDSCRATLRTKNLRNSRISVRISRSGVLASRLGRSKTTRRHEPRLTITSPGRFYASFIVKLVLVEMIQTYDFQMQSIPEKRYFTWRSSLIPWPKLQFEVCAKQTRRQETRSCGFF
jgi:hypothetical protein